MALMENQTAVSTTLGNRKQPRFPHSYRYRCCSLSPTKTKPERILRRIHLPEICRSGYNNACPESSFHWPVLG